MGKIFAGMSDLPPYSPNLNPIERLWRVMNEEFRNNVSFTSARRFREAISKFFETTILKIAQLLRERINDNFQTINQYLQVEWV
jgi:transposase